MNAFLARKKETRNKTCRPPAVADNKGSVDDSSAAGCQCDSNISMWQYVKHGMIRSPRHPKGKIAMQMTREELLNLLIKLTK